MIGRFKLVLFLVSFTLILFLALSTTTNAAARVTTVNNSTGPVAEYTSIQEAVNSANEGDTILVYPGNYTENVYVNVANISIRSYSENPEDTVVIAQNPIDNVFNVSSDFIDINGFTIKGAKWPDIYYSDIAGIALYNVSGASIYYNIFSGNSCGIYLNNSSRNFLIKNNVTESACGIYLVNSSNSNILTNNTITENTFGIHHRSSNNNTLIYNKVKSSHNGIYFVSCNNNRLAENEVTESDFRGIILSSSSNNNLTKNMVYSNYCGIYLVNFSKNNTLISNSLWDNDFNFDMDTSSVIPNTIYSNNLVNGKSIYYLSNTSDVILDHSANAGTIYLINCTNFTMKDLLLEKNAYGVYLNNVTYSTLVNTTVLNTSCGLFMENSSYNTIYNNCFFNRHSNLVLVGRNVGNIWNTTKVPGKNIVGGSFLGGNLWAKLDGRGFSQKNPADADGDGICDLFYSIDGNNTDYLPLLNSSVQLLTYDSVGETSTGHQKWNYTNFDIFYYKSINGSGTENLTVDITEGIIINESDIVYRTDIKPIKYQCQMGERRGQSYPVLGLFGNMLVPLESESNGSSRINSNKFAKLLIDSDDKYSLIDNDVFFLGEGYALKVRWIDGENESFWLELDKDNKLVDEILLNVSSKYDGFQGADWTVKLDNIENEDNVTIMKVHVNQIFQSAFSNIVQIEGIWLIDYKNAFTIEPGDEFGALTVSSIGDNYLEMKNNKPIILEKNSIHEIAKGLNFKVLDSSELIYYPFKEVTINPEENSLINDFYPLNSEVYTDEGEVQKFGISTGRNSNITFLVNGDEVKSKDSTTYFSYQNSNAPKGIYYVRAVAGTEDEEALHSWIWIVGDEIEDSDSTENGGQNNGGSSSRGGGGAGGSPEPASNVEIKELSQAFITNGKHVKFDFTRNVTSIKSVEFDAKRTFGKTTATIEMLKGKSQLVSQLPPGIVYKNINIWVGNQGMSSAENIENAVVYFKVEKSWLTENNVSISSIYLYRYHDNTWNSLKTAATGEDDKYVYLRAETPGFSPFAITGEREAEDTNLKTISKIEDANESSVENMNSTLSKPQQNVKSPGFGAWIMISGLLCGIEWLKMKKK